MEIRFAKSASFEGVPALFLGEGDQLAAHPFFKLLNTEDQRFLGAFLKKSQLKNSHSHLVFLPSGSQVILLGLPKREQFMHRKAILAMRRVVQYARRERVQEIALTLEDFKASDFRGSAGDLAEILGTQLELANFEFTHYKTPPPEGWTFVERIAVLTKRRGQVIQKKLAAGKIIGEEINKMRVLANMPGADMTPEALAEAAVQAGKSNGFSVRVMDEREMKKLGMGGVLGVSKGSAERPWFIVMEYLPARDAGLRGKKSEKPIVLVGKGVTFDTGGLNLKPESGIYEMHMDMSGGAAVIHTIAALARLGVKQNVIGLVPAVENMPSGSSYHPGDLLKTMSGKIIEVLNTDAEGRVILADALTYAKRYQPQLIVDVATLTGAAMAALGQRASVIFATSHELEDAFRESGERTGDYVWPLPLWEEFEEDIKGTFGDWANVGKTRYGGAITGAMFLWQFVKDDSQKPATKSQLPAWVHIDIAPRMTTIEGDFLAKGSAGASVALLVDFLRATSH